MRERDGEHAVRTADERGHPPVVRAAQAAVPVHGHREVDVLEERGELTRVRGVVLQRRDVPLQVFGLHDRVDRRTRGLGRRGCDLRGPLLQPAVHREEPEP